MTDLQDDQSRTNVTVTQRFPANTGSHDGDEALALTLAEFEAVRRPSDTGWRHFLRLQELACAPVEFHLNGAAEMSARLSWIPNDFLDLLAGVHADVGEAPALALPVLYRRLLGHLAQLKGAP